MAEDPAGDALRRWELQGGPRQSRPQPPEIEEQLPLDAEIEEIEEVEEEAPPSAVEDELSLDVCETSAAPPDTEIDEEELPQPSDSEDERSIADSRTIALGLARSPRIIEDTSQWAEDHPCDTFAIKVYRLTGGGAITVEIRNGASATVRELKVAIMIATGAPCGLQQLTHESEILNDDTVTLGSVGLEHGMSIILDEQDSYKLTEKELADLQEAFLRRIDTQSAEAELEIDVAALSPTTREILESHDLSPTTRQIMESPYSPTIVPFSPNAAESNLANSPAMELDCPGSVQRAVQAAYKDGCSWFRSGDTSGAFLDFHASFSPNAAESNLANSHFSPNAAEALANSQDGSSDV